MISHASIKLAPILSEMQNPKFYYSQPYRKHQISCVVPGKQEEWISRLSMIKNELEEVIEAEGKIKFPIVPNV